MPTATVTVQYVNPPKGRGPASIKDDSGTYYKFWTKTIPVRTFREGDEYTVVYHVEDYRGEDQYYIDDVVGSPPQSAPKPAAQQSQSQPQFSTEKTEDISVLAILKAMQPLPVGDVAALVHALKSAAMAWRQYKEWQKNKSIETSPRRSMKDELGDEEIPY